MGFINSFLFFSLQANLFVSSVLNWTNAYEPQLSHGKIWLAVLLMPKTNEDGILFAGFLFKMKINQHLYTYSASKINKEFLNITHMTVQLLCQPPLHLGFLLITDHWSLAPLLRYYVLLLRSKPWKDPNFWCSSGCSVAILSSSITSTAKNSEFGDVSSAFREKVSRVLKEGEVSSEASRERRGDWLFRTAMFFLALLLHLFRSSMTPSVKTIALIDVPICCKFSVDLFIYLLNIVHACLLIFLVRLFSEHTCVTRAYRGSVT